MDIVGGLSRGNSEKGMRFCRVRYDASTEGLGLAVLAVLAVALGICSKVVKPPTQDYDVTRTNIRRRLLTTYSR